MFVGEGPLSDADAAFQEDDGEGVGIFEFEGELVVEEWVDGVV